MNFAAQYRCIGETGVDEITQLLTQLSENHWLDDQSIQNNLDGHQQAQTIPLVWDDDFRHKKPTKRAALNMFGGAIRPALTIVADFFESDGRWQKYLGDNGRGYFIRAYFLKLKAGATITTHQDKNYSLAHSHQIHMPITTNHDVFFDIGEMTMNLLQGEVVEINNRMPYSVMNKSESDMVHLVLDWVIPGEKCCCGERLRPSETCNAETCLNNDSLVEACHCFKNDAIV